MSDIKATGFTIDSSLEKAADIYDATAVGIDVFLHPNKADRIALEVGLTDPIAGPVRIGHLTGVIDQYALAMQHDGYGVQLSGRDLAAELLERLYQKLYLVTQPDAGQEPTTPYVVGQFRASEIARDVVTAAGLKLDWQCHDYAIQETFSAAGRSIDILRTLVEPFSQVPMFAVDIYVQGTVVVCMARGDPPATQYTYSFHDARIKELTSYTKKRLPVIGTLRLEGMRGTGTAFGGWIFPGSSEATEEDTSDTKDEAGNIIGRVSSKKTYRMPDKILLSSLDQTFDLKGGVLTKVKEAAVTNEWEPSKYNPTGAANQPKQLSQVTLNSGIHPQDKSKTFQELEKVETAFSYDADGFLVQTKVRKYSLNLAKKKIIESERISKTLRDTTMLDTEEVTDTLKPKSDGTWYVQNTNTSRSNGLRPGGRKPPPTRSSSGASLAPITLTRVITTPVAPGGTQGVDPWGKDVRYSNPHMTEAELEFIADQFEDASGLWECVIQFRAVTMPWLKKGTVIELTGLADQDGTAIPIEPAIVTNNVLRYDESSEQPEMTSTVTAVFWTNTP